MDQIKKIAFPRYANYNIPLKYVVEHGLHAKYVMQPEMTHRTEELGEKYCPDYVCTPFKTTLGSMIESLEAGANFLFMTHGACRLSYFGELQEQILRDLGYEFEFLNMQEYNTGKKKDWLKALKKVDPDVNVVKFTAAVRNMLKMMEYIDDMTYEYYKVCGFDPTHKNCYRVYSKFLRDMNRADTRKDIDDAYYKAKHDLSMVELKRPDTLLKVGIVGELFTAMDPFSNRNIEQKIADMGVEVHRWMNMSHMVAHYDDMNLLVQVNEYIEFDMGPTSIENIWTAKKYAQEGFDGLIHIKSANCTPETDITVILQRISNEYKIPLLILTYDTQTSDVGLMTRIEAFYDMIYEKKRVM